MTGNDDRIHEARFLSLVLSLHGSAWVAMGKVANPVTGKVEKDLEAARGSIDLLETLKVRTKGNLTGDEEKTLANALSVLQLNFVDELAREKEGDKSQISNPESQDSNPKSQIPNPKNQNPNPKSQKGDKGAAGASTGEKAADAPPPGGA